MLQIELRFVQPEASSALLIGSVIPCIEVQGGHGSQFGREAPKTPRGWCCHPGESFFLSKFLGIKI